MATVFPAQDIPEIITRLVSFSLCSKKSPPFYHDSLESLYLAASFFTSSFIMLYFILTLYNEIIEATMNRLILSINSYSLKKKRHRHEVCTTINSLLY